MSAPPDEAPSYLKSSINKFSPWSRSPVVQPSKGKEGEPEPLLRQQAGQDHVVSHRHRLSLRRYPRDCPPLRPQWFHAVDVPKRRPNPAGEREGTVKPLGTPKKYAAFSIKDSKSVEAAFQKIADEEDAGVRDVQDGDLGSVGFKAEKQPNKSLRDDGKPGKIRVPVNEDYLFDVDVEKRELGPAYWLGPVYDVRRGTWFYQDGSVQRPCDENLAAQLEEGYLKVKAWRLPSAKEGKEKQSAMAAAMSEAKPRPTSWTPGQFPEGDLKKDPAKSLSAKGSNPDLRRDTVAKDPAKTETAPESGPNNTYRLFGAHMNSVVTYQDGNTAWLLTDDFMSRMNYSMYQRFAGGGHFAGVKMTRGYIPTGKKVEKDGKTPEAGGTPKRTASQEREADPTKVDAQPGQADEGKPPIETRRQTLERQMSSLLEDSHDPEKQDEELRRRDEREIEDDYRDLDGEDQDREIEHLILVTHGIGQRLGLRLESVNFVHDVNTFRKTIKAVYSDSPDLRALNAELDAASKVNCRIQVLPICWRHLLDFPKQSLKHNRREHDLADSGFGEEEEYPNLADISVEGVPAVRNLITDLALDILLYQSPAYKGHISRIVLEECNRIYHLFMQRNPEFKGKVSLVGHSLGSAIMFDILCRQDRHGQVPQGGRKDKHAQKLDFQVEDFYALGSPIGLFQMLKGRTIAARNTTSSSDFDPTSPKKSSSFPDESLLHPDPLTTSTSSKKPAPTNLPSSAALSTDIPTSSPKCAQVFNIFHPTDPISYRLEPLISPAMATLKPQPLPYTKRGLFGAPVGQGLTGIGARVGQSVSSLWSSMSSGLASSLLTRGLGYTGEEPVHLPASGSDGAAKGKSAGPLSTSSMGGGAGGVAGAQQPDSKEFAQRVPDAEKQARLASDALAAGQAGEHPPTLIDQEIETLYAGFEKERRSSAALGSNPLAKDDAASATERMEAEARGRKLRREEAKVRRLNGNGRVDYAIQEGAWDINLLAAIASHLSYWADEDVGHFVVSQLLSRSRGQGREMPKESGKST